MTENYDSDKYSCFEYGILFHTGGTFSLLNGGFSKNKIIFGVDMSPSVHVDNKRKVILIPGEGTTQGLDDTILTAEAQYSTSFT